MLLASCTASDKQTDIHPPDGSESVELREYKGADSNPPWQEIDGSTVQPAIIDWKSPAAKELLKDDSKELSKFPVLKIGESLDIEISSPLEPAALELSVFRGSMNEIDPAGPPDHIVDMLTSDLVSKTTSSGTLVYSLDRGRDSGTRGYRCLQPILRGSIFVSRTVYQLSGMGFFS